METAILSLLFLQLIRVSHSTEDIRVFQPDENSAISFANFEVHKSHRLLLPSAVNSTTNETSYVDCAFSCVLLPWCLSYNFQNTPDKYGKHLCEALSIDKYNNSKDFRPSVDFDHYSIVSPCAEHPCQNGGSCVALYDKNDFTCVCPQGFKGRQCEVKLPSTCKEIFDEQRAKEDKPYSLLMDSGKVQVYCHMTDISGCNGGGWTLVMKIDGSKETFAFNSLYWSDNNTYNLAGGMTGLDSEETKLPTYWNTPFTKICLGMKVRSETRFILLPKQARSLYSLIADGVHRATSLTRDTWKSLIAGSSLQLNCAKEGFNTKADDEASNAKSRIGILGNQENDCNTPDSVIGFGNGDYPYSTTCGNGASEHNADNGPKDTAAMGYIFIQ